MIMSPRNRFPAAIVLFLISMPVATGGSTPESNSAQELVGLWKAKRWFGPDARGPLVIQRTPSGWTADFVGRTLPVQAEGSGLSF